VTPANSASKNPAPLSNDGSSGGGSRSLTLDPNQCRMVPRNTVLMTLSGPDTSIYADPRSPRCTNIYMVRFGKPTACPYSNGEFS
jgi:hypothetical protein